MPEPPRTLIDAPPKKLELLRRLQAETRKQEAELVRQERQLVLKECTHPALLAQRFDPSYVITPAVELVSKALAETVTGRAGRRVVSVPPQEMKTSLLRWLGLWTLVQNPNCRMIFASYAEDLARQSGRIVRSYVEGYGPDFGLDTDKSHRDAAEWELDGAHSGGMTSVGIGGGLTGKPCDCFVESTRVTTTEGPVTIGELHRRSTRPDVASWDERTGAIRWNRIVASRRIEGRPLVDVITHGGRRLRCTPDHRLFVVDRGWVAANELREGDRLRVAAPVPGLRDAVRTPSEPAGAQRQRDGLLLEAVPSGQPASGRHRVHRLWGDVQEAEVRPEGRLGHEVLHQGVHDRPQRGDRRGAGLSSVRSLDGHDPRAQEAEVLLGGVRGGVVRDDDAGTWPAASHDDYETVRSVRGRRDPAPVRASEGGASWAAGVLLEEVRLGAAGSRGREVQSVREADPKGEGRPVLFGRVPQADLGRRQAAGPRVSEKPSGYHVPGVRGDVQAAQQSHDVLLKGLRERRALRAADRRGKLALQGWHELRRVVQADAATRHGEGWVLPRLRHHPGADDVHAEREAGAAVVAGGAPHRREPTKQRAAEPDHVVPGVPHDAPSLGVDTVAVVRPVRGASEPVYDIQVDRDYNFFAEEVLAHNCLIIDDPIRNQADADSPTVRQNLMEWWQAVARLRLHPAAPVIVVQTRWKETDLAGTLIDQGWPYINIPALADGQTEDALNRPPGTYLESTRGRTPEDWEAIRADVGERTWAALLQGRPAPLEGGIFKKAWFDNGRVDAAPELKTIVIGVDPAETGTGDEAGIIVAGAADDGQLYVMADLSGMLSQAQWARRICIGMLRYEAQRVLAERTLGMNSAIVDAWRIITRQARALASAQDTDEPITEALHLLRAAGDDMAADPGQLRELLGLEDSVSGFPTTGPRVVTVTPRHSKRIRAEAVTSLFEFSRAHIVGNLPLLEHECLTFTEDMKKSPNRVDVLAHVLSHLEQSRAKASVARRPRHLQVVPTATVMPLAR